MKYSFIFLVISFFFILANSCPQLKLKKGVNLQCLNPITNISTSCFSNPVPSGTIAKFSCEQFYINREIPHGEIQCYADKWESIYDYEDFNCEIECGNTKMVNPSIVFGRYASKYKFPWHATIFRKIDGEYRMICGGNLINLNNGGFLILTAGHCLTQNSRSTLPGSPSEFKVVLGASSSLYSENINDESQIFDINSFDIHPSYTSSLEHDIAIIKLSRDIQLSDSAKPICLERKVSGPKSGEIGKISGFGITEEGFSSDKLLYTELPIRTPEECQKHIPSHSKYILSSFKFCAGHPAYNESDEISEKTSTGICFGDSGGGFVQFNSRKKISFLTGIVSASIRDELISCAGFGFYIDVNKYIGWIREMQNKYYNEKSANYEIDEDTYDEANPLNVVQIKNFGNDLYLDVDHGSAEGKPVVLWIKSVELWQRWIVNMTEVMNRTPTKVKVLHQDGGRIKILDEDVGNQTIAVWGEPVAYWPNQLWVFKMVTCSKNLFIIVNHSTQRCLHSQGKSNQLTGEPCSACDPNQLWSIENQHIPKKIWREHWYEHNQTLKLVFNDKDVSIYFDNEVQIQSSSAHFWFFSFVGDIWRHFKKEFKIKGPNERLFAVFHVGKYYFGHRDDIYGAIHENKNFIDIAAHTWDRNASNFNKKDIDFIIENMAFVLESAHGKYTGGKLSNIWSFGLRNIIMYDAYKSLGMEEDAQRVYNREVTVMSSDEPKGVFWFRDFFYPVYANHGGMSTFVKYLEFLQSKYPSAMNWFYPGDISTGQFVLFWSGIINEDIKPIAKQKFIWSEADEKDWEEAKAKYPDIKFEPFKNN